MKQKILEIDGAFGEGGGQIIRTALALSMITQTPIDITNIRAGRKKSGLMRQHLVCVEASQRISHADVTGASLGSTALTFRPQQVVAGEYHFDIGSAGSTNLVLQTIMPALWLADSPSTVTIKGGTHNPLAPTADFLTHGFFPAIQQMGLSVDYQLRQAGFAPVGGGEIRATIQPLDSSKNPPFSLVERGELLGIELVASELNLSIEIAERELASATTHLADNTAIPQELLQTKVNSLKGIGEGNNCFAVVKSQTANSSHQEVFTLLGEKRTSAENIGKRLAGLVNRYLSQPTCVDEYLADQLLLPLALTGGGEFSCRCISEHTRTQAVMIEKFLPVAIRFDELAKGYHVTVKVS